MKAFHRSIEQGQHVFWWTTDDRHAVVDQHRTLHAARECQNELGPTLNRAGVTVRTIGNVLGTDTVGVDGNRQRILWCDAVLEVPNHIELATSLFEQRKRLT